MTPQAAVLGRLEVDVAAAILGTGYMRFESSLGIHGLAKVDGHRLDVLAVMATKPGTGQFRAFIDCCQREYQQVYIWEDWNPLVGKALAKYGFERVSEVSDGEPLQGWKWSVCEEQMVDPAKSEAPGEVDGN